MRSSKACRDGLTSVPPTTITSGRRGSLSSTGEMVSASGIDNEHPRPAIGEDVCVLRHRQVRVERDAIAPARIVPQKATG